MAWPNVTTLAVTAAGAGAGIEVTAPQASTNRGVLAVLHIPALNAGTHNVESSLDGSTWYAVTADYDGNTLPTTTSTAQRRVIGPLVAGGKIRITSSVAQTASATVAFIPA